MSGPLAVVVLAAGKGTRTKLSIPKVLLPLCGRTLLSSVLDTVAQLEPDRTLVVLSHAMDKVTASLEASSQAKTPGLEIVDQGSPRGTGHAVQVAMAKLGEFAGDVLVVYGDCPLITPTTLSALREARGEAPAAVLTAYLPDPSGLGRIRRDEEGVLVGIVEDGDCSPEELEIDEINAGFYCFDPARLGPALDSLTVENVQGEYYLTDVIAHFTAADTPVPTVEVEDVDEVLGVNSLTELALAREIMQESILLRHMESGVQIEDPSTTYIDHDVEIGPETSILPCTVLRSGVRIGSGCQVGPFAHLRVGTVLEEGAEVGNFVETKKSTVGRRSKAKHLTYLGDTTIGEGANVGAGTITANYDGEKKHETLIGDGAFVGSGTVLVAPSRMGVRSRTGAGAIVTPGTEIGDGETFVGVPAKLLRPKGKGGDSPKGMRDAR